MFIVKEWYLFVYDGTCSDLKADREETGYRQGIS